MHRPLSLFSLGAAAAVALSSAVTFLSTSVTAGLPDFSATPKAFAHCSEEWLACAKSEPCTDAMKSVYACFLDKKEGVPACLAGLDVNASSVAGLEACIQANKTYAGIDRLTHIPNVPPAKIWPLIYDLNNYVWTDLVSAKCSSPGCNATAPLPGDKLFVQVVVFVDKRKIPAAPIPLVKVEEVITPAGCVGLPGRCAPVDADYLAITDGKAPVYRVLWGPNYAGLFGYQHYFDLLDDDTGTGTIFYHHEFYTGIAGALFGEKLLVPLFTQTIDGQNADMAAYAAANLVAIGK